MKCLVGVKRVVDYRVRVSVHPDNHHIETEHLKKSMNPFDEIALEEAVRLKEAGIVEEIIITTIGPLDAEDILREGLARGADRAILIEYADELESLNIAKILQAIVQEIQPRLVLLGKQAIDDDCNQTGQMLAALLDWSQGTFVSQLSIKKDSIEVEREVDNGLEVLNLTLPSIITADLRLNEPRYLSLPNIMRAKSKPLEVKSLKELGVELKKHLQLQKVELAETKRKGARVETVKELVHQLKNESNIW